VLTTFILSLFEKKLIIFLESSKNKSFLIYFLFVLDLITVVNSPRVFVPVNDFIANNVLFL